MIHRFIDFMPDFGEGGNFGQGQFGIGVIPAPSQVTADLTVTYNITGRAAANLVVVYNVQSDITPSTAIIEVVEERLPTDLDRFAQRAYDIFEPLTLHQESDDLNFYIGAAGELFQEVDDLVRDTEGGDPGWSILLDVHRIPAKGLDWLAQFVGVTIDHNTDEAGVRQQVRAHDRWGRGTPLSMLGPAAHWLPAGAKMYLSERNPTPYSATFIFVDKPGVSQSYGDLYAQFESYHKLRIAYATYGAIFTDQRGDWAKVQDVILANKPAGIQIGFIFTDTTLYMAIYILFNSYQEVYDAYATYQQLYTQPFPDISIDIPKYRQLISTRYYRSIYHQFESYQLVYDTFVTY